MTPAQRQELLRLVNGMDALDYFQLLRLNTTCTPAELKSAFYRDSRVYHPDRVFHLEDPLAKQAIHSIYKRLTEAYSVLKDDVRRRKYLADIAGPERARKLRYTEAAESEVKAEVRRQAEEEYGTNPKARQFYKTALADMEKSNWQAAERNLKSALTFEPGNARFKEKLAEVVRKADEWRKTSGDAFKIK